MYVPLEVGGELVRVEAVGPGAGLGELKLLLELQDLLAEPLQHRLVVHRLVDLRAVHNLLGTRRKPGGWE